MWQNLTLCNHEIGCWYVSVVLVMLFSLKGPWDPHRAYWGAVLAHVAQGSACSIEWTKCLLKSAIYLFHVYIAIKVYSFSLPLIDAPQEGDHSAMPGTWGRWILPVLQEHAFLWLGNTWMAGQRARLQITCVAAPVRLYFCCLRTATSNTVNTIMDRCCLWSG